jgi:hypothetical protein
MRLLNDNAAVMRQWNDGPLLPCCLHQATDRTKLHAARRCPAAQERAIPALVDIIKAPDTSSSVLVEGALDILAALLRPSSPQQAAAVHSAASSHVMGLALHQDDPAILQSCSEYLRSVRRLLAPKPRSESQACDVSRFDGNSNMIDSSCALKQSLGQHPRAPYPPLCHASAVEL